METATPLSTHRCPPTVVQVRVQIATFDVAFGASMMLMHAERSAAQILGPRARLPLFWPGCQHSRRRSGGHCYSHEPSIANVWSTTEIVGPRHAADRARSLRAQGAHIHIYHRHRLTEHNLLRRQCRTAPGESARKRSAYFESCANNSTSCSARCTTVSRSGRTGRIAWYRHGGQCLRVSVL